MKDESSLMNVIFLFQARKISRFLVSPVIDDLIRQAVSINEIQTYRWRYIFSFHLTSSSGHYCRMPLMIILRRRKFRTKKKEDLRIQRSQLVVYLVEWRSTTLLDRNIKKLKVKTNDDEIQKIVTSFIVLKLNLTTLNFASIVGVSQIFAEFWYILLKFVWQN